MARIYDTAKSTLALRQRKRFLLAQLKIPADALRASLVERFARCGKANCHCHHGGQQQTARTGIAHYQQVQEQLEELSQINAELLRRQETLGDE